MLNYQPTGRAYIYVQAVRFLIYRAGIRLDTSKHLRSGPRWCWFAGYDVGVVSVRMPSHPPNRTPLEGALPYLLAPKNKLNEVASVISTPSIFPERCLL